MVYLKLRPPTPESLTGNIVSYSPILITRYWILYCVNFRFVFVNCQQGCTWGKSVHQFDVSTKRMVFMASYRLAPCNLRLGHTYK